MFKNVIKQKFKIFINLLLFKKVSFLTKKILILKYKFFTLSDLKY